MMNQLKKIQTDMENVMQENIITGHSLYHIAMELWTKTPFNIDNYFQAKCLF